MDLFSSVLDQIEGPLNILIRDTGEFIRAEFRQFSFSQVQYKSQSNPVTHVDLQAEEKLKQACAKLIPGSGFLNEETAAEATTNGFTWIIDPIDGTTNFAHGIPHFSISLALEYESQIVLGFVYHVMAEEMFAARIGKGATLNGAPMQTSAIPQVSESVLATGFPYGNHPWLESFLDLVMQIMRQGQGLRRMGSAALDLAYVGAGRMEAFFERGLNPWDVAAGILIVQEAGGKVSDFSGGDGYIDGQQLFASNGHIHKEVLGIMQNVGHSRQLNRNT